MNWWVVGGFVALGVVAIWWMESRKQVSTTNHAAVGKQPKVLRLEPLNVEGSPETLESLRGNVLVITFFLPGSPTTRGELSMLAEVSRQWGQDRVRVLPVSCAQDASQESRAALQSETEAMLKQLGIDSLTVYSDPDQTTREAFRQLGVFNGSYPTTVLLDAGGRVLAVLRNFHLVHNGRDIRAVLTQELER